MKRLRWGVGVLTSLAVLLPIQASAVLERHSGPPDRIALPDGWQPEGITTDGRALFVGSLANGAIWRADPRSGKGRVLAVGRRGRVAVGIDHDRRRDLLWVAGGATGKIRAHDADTGKVRARYVFPAPGRGTARFLNDLVVTRRGVFATDSVHKQLAVVPLRRRHALPRPAAARTLRLTGDLRYATGFNLNGIVSFQGALLAVQSNTGKLYRIHPRTGDTELVDLHGARLTNGDGLERDGRTLYVVRNQLERIAVVELDGDADEGRVRDELTSDDFDVPTTAAVARGSLWLVNARFGTTATADTDYWVTRLDQVAD